MSVKKVVGSDKELGITCLGQSLAGSSPARLVQQEINGVRRSSGYYYSGSWDGANTGYWTGGYNYQDHSGSFLTNGGCQYIDMNHPEVCTPECTSAMDFLKYTHAGLRLAQRAANAANEKLDGSRIILYNDNTDRSGHAYGSHLNVQLSAATFNKAFYGVMFPHLSFLGSFQASSILLSGGGKVGNETSGDSVDYQISRRAEFIETFVGTQTTHHRPLVGSRDEALGNTARLHTIFADATLFHFSNYLAAGSLQLICSMMEAGSRFMNANLCLEDPVSAIYQWSCDPGLQRKMALIDGKKVTATEHQLALIDEVGRYIENGYCCDVPDADRILQIWHSTIEMLHLRHFDRAAGRLEWLCKYHFLQEQIDHDKALSWQSPELKVRDLLFSVLDPEIGTYWQFERAGLIETLVEEAEINFCETHPPKDTRAWLRGNLISASDSLVSVNWDQICVDHSDRRYKIYMPGVTSNTAEDYPDFSDPESLLDQLIETSEGEAHETNEHTYERWHYPTTGYGYEGSH